MTLSVITVRVQYNGDGTTTTFPVPFVFWEDDDLQVILTDSAGVEEIWVRGTQYTVTGGSSDTGTIVVKTTPTDYTPAVGETLTILSNLPDTQTLSLPAGGKFPSASVEQELDQIVRMIQQQRETLDRTVTLTLSSAKTGITVPDPEAGKLIRWNSAASAFENVDASVSTLTLPLSLADGGTGGTTALAALLNLGIARARLLAAQRVSLWKLGAF